VAVVRVHGGMHRVGSALLTGVPVWLDARTASLLLKAYVSNSATAASSKTSDPDETKEPGEDPLRPAGDRCFRAMSFLYH
jgi:hypothetical protein